MAGNESGVLALHMTRKGGERLRELVGGSPAARLLGLEESPKDFARKAFELKPEVLLVEMTPNLNGVGALLEKLARMLPQSSVVAVAESRDPDQILGAMRMGVKEYLAEPVTPQSLNDAVIRLSRLTQAAGSPVGRLLAVMGVKGGVGTSHLALNLAHCLSQAGQGPVALVDLDMFSGDLAALMDQTSNRDLTEVPANFDNLDRLFVEGLLSEVTPDLKLLAAPPDPVAAEDIKTDHVSRVLDMLMDGHWQTVLDLPSRLDEVSLMALDRADRVIYVLEPTVVGLAAAQRMLGLSRRLGHDEDKIEVVVNRDGAKGCLSRQEVQKTLEAKVTSFLPNESRVIMEAANCGRPVVSDWPKVKWSKQVTGLAGRLGKAE